MLLQPFPRTSLEKMEHPPERTNAQDCRYIPLNDLAPGFGPPCPWLDMDSFYRTKTTLPPRRRKKGRGRAHGEERPKVDCLVLLFPSFFPAAFAR